MLARRLLARLVDIREGEVLPGLLAAAQFFCLLFGYFMMRPLREAMGLDGPPEQMEARLRLLVLATVGVMVVGNVAWGLVASRVRRGVLVPSVYVGSILCLGGFVVAMRWAGEGGNLAIGSVFFVWLSVFNLFAVSVFWQLLADVFPLEQSKRLFGFISVGGTAGAIAGSAYSWRLAEALGPMGLIASAAVFIGLAAVVSVVLCRAAGNGEAARPVGGAAWSGLTRMVASPYLLAIGGVVLIFTIVSTLLYFEKMSIVAAATEDRSERASLFAGIELSAQVLTLVLQLFLTGWLMRRLGVGVLLMAVPLVSVVGFGVLAVAPTLTVLTVFEATRRAANFALSKPAKETLFTVVSRDEKYKAKAAIDTFVYRGGDTLGTFVDKGIGLLAAPAAVVAIPLSVVGVGLAWWLGRREKELDARGGGTPRSETIEQEGAAHAAVAS